MTKLQPGPGAPLRGPGMFPGIGVPPGPATGPHVVKKGGPSGPKESSGWSPRFPPVRAGTNKGQRSHARRPPLGQPQLNVPRERSRPRGRPLQPRFPKEHHHHRAADDSLTAQRPQASIVFSLEMEREEGREGRALAATSAPLASSAGSRSFKHRSQAHPASCSCMRQGG